jgi:hypothetical protein
MESPREVHESKAFRWVGHLSEEELLGGPPASVSRPNSASFEPRPLPVSAAVPMPSPVLADPLTVAPRWRLQARDLIALVAVGAAVWFALRGAEGLPFRSSEAVAPPSASGLVTMNVALDRQELRSLPHAANASRGGRVKGSDDRAGESGSNHDSKPPPGETSTPPLLQATVPGVGPVTLDQPETPELPVEIPTLDTPSLPGAGDLLLQTSTVSLP